MINRLPVLGGVLVVQLILIGASQFLGGSDDQAAPFLAFDPLSITHVAVADGEGARVELVKADTGWQFVEPSTIPADDEKITKVLEKLSNLGSPWPVATSATSRTRFEVTQENHQRNVQLSAGDSLVADLYLGTSPGYRRVHARSGDDDEVYSVDFANFEVPAAQDDWLDKSLLQAEDITAVALTQGWSLTRDGENWLVDGAPADAEEARILVNRISQIRVLGFRESAETPLDSPRTLSVTSSGGDYQLTIAHDAENNEYAVSSNRLDGSYSLASYVAEQILIDAAELAVAIEEAATEVSSEESETENVAAEEE